MRLSEATRGRLPPAVEKPTYDRLRQRTGIVHLGIGAFHRAHQAMYTDAALAAGDRDWLITGVSLRSALVRDQLAPQDGLFTITERDGTGERTRLVGAVRAVLVATEQPSAVTRSLAHADTRVVTLTVTEKGYHRAPDGALDLDAVRAAGGTIYHHLGTALAARRGAGLPGLTLVSCDNLADNGRVLHGLVAEWLEQEDPGLASWFARECACPSTMVDRIVPATRDADRVRLEDRLGLRDEAAVLTEPFSQWIVEDRFAGARPDWERGGARIVADVLPYEAAKLRMLNGAHSALAYLGLAAGHAHVHEAIADSDIRPVVERLMRDEAAASLDPAPGQDLSAYAGALLARFANHALAHRLSQIAMDGSQKIVPRFLEPLAINALRQIPCPATLHALAAWIFHVRREGSALEDPMADRLAQLWREAGQGGIVDALFGPVGLYAARWIASPADRATLRRSVEEFSYAGTARDGRPDASAARMRQET